MTFDLIEHKDGIWWYEAPLPPKKHECEPWTSAWEGFTQVQRCACGSIRMNPDRVWIEVNARRAAEPEPKKRWWRR
jgi:hypothetical protein